MSGRRIHERFDLVLPVVVVHDGAEIQATTADVSLGGMFLRLSEPLAYGTELTVRFQLPILKEPTEAKVLVRSCRQEGVGVQWCSLRAIEVWAINQCARRDSGDVLHN